MKATGLKIHFSTIRATQRKWTIICDLNYTSKLGHCFLWEIGGTKFYEKDIDLLLSIHKKPTGVAYVYLEPFMKIADEEKLPDGYKPGEMIY